MGHQVDGEGAMPSESRVSQIDFRYPLLSLSSNISTPHALVLLALRNPAYSRVLSTACRQGVGGLCSQSSSGEGGPVSVHSSLRSEERGDGIRTPSARPCLKAPISVTPSAI